MTRPRTPNPQGRGRSAEGSAALKKKRPPPKKLTKREREQREVTQAVTQSARGIVREALKTKRSAEGAVVRVHAQAKREERARERAKARKAMAALRKAGIEIKTSGSSGGRGLDLAREITGNAVTEAGAIVKGLPKAGYSIVRDTGRNIEKGQDPITALSKAFADPQVEYTKHKYGPLLPGGRPARETLEQIKKEPLSTALDIAAPVSVTLGTARRVVKFGRAKGGPVKRYRASKELPKTRTLTAGKAEAQFPASPSALTRGAQRGRDVLSKKVGTAPSRIAKQRARQIRTDISRRQAAFAEDIGKVAAVPKKQRAATFFEAQLPKEARGGTGLQRVEADLRDKAKIAGETGKTRDAERLLIQAERVKRGREQGFDPTDPVGAIGRLAAERERIFTDAGKLSPETAERMRGSFAREMGYEDTTGAGYVGHRTREAPLSIQRLGQTRVTSKFIGPAKTPPGIGQQRTGAAYGSGKVRADPRVAVEDWQHAQRFEFQNIARKELAKFGEPIEGRPKPGYYVMNPEGHKLPRTWKEHDPREAARAEGINVEAVVEGDLREYIQNYIARAGTPEAAALIEKAPGGVVQVSPQVVHKFFNQFENRAGVSFGKGTKQIDAVNDLMRLSTIYANPGYLPAQWFGNASMSIAHQAFYLPGNLMRAANTLRGKHGAELRSRILVETGAPGTSAIVSEGKSAISRGVRKFAGAMSQIADDPWRVAAWYHEARRANYRTTQQQLNLLRKAERGDLQARTIANDLRQRTNNAMVDFERLGPAERAVAARFLFVLPWVRGAIRYPGRFALDYPGRTAVAVHAAQEAERDPSLKFLGPDYLSQAFPVGPQRDGMQKVINPRSAFTASTPMETLQTLGQAATGKGRGALSDFLAPQYRMLLHGLEGRNRFGQKVGATRAVQEDLENISPLRTLLQEVADPSRAPKVYGPQTQGEVLKRRLGRGMIPFQIDLSEAREQGLRDQRARMSPEERLHARHADYGKEILEGAQKTGLLKKGQPLPPQLRRALKLREERFQNRADAKDARERFEADVGFLRKQKLIDARAASKAIRWVRGEPRDALVQDELDRISRKYFSPLYGEALSDARRKLKEKGYDLPELR